jgi:uncharacterized protein
MRALSRRTALRAVVPAAIAALMLSAACAPDDNGNGVDPGDDGVLEHMRLGTGSTGGTYFPLGGGMAAVWTGEIDGLRVSTQATGASVENLRLLQAGEIELGLAVNGVAVDALNNAGTFADDPEFDFTAIGNVYGEVMQVIARADAGVETIEDLAGLRVQIGPPGSGTEVMARMILESHGIDPDSDITPFNDTFGDAADQMRDGTVDAAFAILALPAASIIEVATATDIVLVDIAGPVLDDMLAADPSLSVLEVAAGTYPNQDAPAQWVTNWATLYAQPWLDEDQVYDLVRVMYESMNPDSVGHAVAAEINLPTAVDGLGGIPLHPGAARYYEEQGIAIP